ncbi:MAG TPA: hemolysin family protein [Blastocatellia bacterium]|nr:hemolysin family protein [Blastocatellia bacterium]
MSSFSLALIVAMNAEIPIACGVLLTLVFLSTVESAYESLSEVSLKLLLAEHEESSRAGFFRELLEHRQRFELMLSFGTQLSIVSIAILAADIIAESGIWRPLLLTFFVTVAVVILFRQLIPRMLSQNNPEQVLWRLLPVFRLYYRFLSIFITPSAAILRRMKKAEPDGTGDEDDAAEAMEEIQALIDVGEEEGILEESESELIQSIFEFSDKRVGEVMRPRPQIVAIEADAPLAEARRLIIEAKYSRIPVYREQIDHIEGILYVRDLLAALEDENGTTCVSKCMRPAYFVPESKPVRQLLEDMQKAKVPMAIVIDEYGGVAGLVTIEDIVEEIVGEIEDEDRAASDSDVVRSEDGSYLVGGSTEIKKVELLFDKDIEADDFKTVAGLVINELGHVPVQGEKLRFKGLEFEVTEADNRRVSRLKLRPIESLDSDSPTETGGAGSE